MGMGEFGFGGVGDSLNRDWRSANPRNPWKKELRETYIWLKLAKELEIGSGPELDEAIAEADEPIGIFVTSIATAKRNAK
ncbi:MAG: hypothetical protein PVJ64_05570 [Gemmatimonadales bacterium]|jgi:hypothetical protein